jgi:Lipase (class 3)
VILAGHSLGGSLALLLALDIAVNHIESESADTCSKYNRKEEATESEISTHIVTEDIFEKSEKIKEGLNVTQDAVRKRDLQCGSYSHHRGRRCTDVADPFILNQMHVVTFGQPDLASSSFFESVKAGSQAAKSLLEER